MSFRENRQAASVPSTIAQIRPDSSESATGAEVDRRREERWYAVESCVGSTTRRSPSAGI